MYFDTIREKTFRFNSPSSLHILIGEFHSVVFIEQFYIISSVFNNPKWVVCVSFDGVGNLADPLLYFWATKPSEYFW